MPPSSSSPVPDISWAQALLLHSIDVGLVLALTYLVLLIIGERRTLWMVRGLIVLMLAAAVSNRLGLTLLSFVLEKLVVGSAVAMAVIFQSEFRRFLEQVGRGQILQLFQAQRRPTAKPDSVGMFLYQVFSLMLKFLKNCCKQFSKRRRYCMMARC
jgi:Uncharacterized conserved protein